MGATDSYCIKYVFSLGYRQPSMDLLLYHAMGHGDQTPAPPPTSHEQALFRYFLSGGTCVQLSMTFHLISPAWPARAAGSEATQIRIRQGSPACFATNARHSSRARERAHNSRGQHPPPRCLRTHSVLPVSYTHLTLPTICSV